ncbi:FadR/GntR family transcriptional regulator [Shumkonia mesophila]|uniref:FadR/GntR family transcriptional regulator n=1 Tax=Shumkonia mesophila TaxID=2838854 RepID=UPI0029348FE2|nr:FadR/GntR family transcriptional regulator [Shumkonia mesophila]
MRWDDASSTYPKRGLCGQVAHKLGQRIVSGDFEAGGVLPTESELSLQFNVSRTALREAVKVLSAKGLTESRPRTGTRVRPRSDWHLVDPDVIAWHCAATPSADFLCDLFEIRLIVEPNAAALAAERRTDDDIRDIRQRLAEMGRAIETGADMVGPNVRFHTAILEAAANPFLGTLAALMTPAFSHMVRIVWQSDPAAFSMADHHLVMDALATGRGGMARRAMQSLLWVTREGLLKALSRKSTKQRLPAETR